MGRGLVVVQAAIAAALLRLYFWIHLDWLRYVGLEGVLFA
jgi:hypothetical protein